MITCDSFKNLKINTEPLGFILGGDGCECFCTPIGAEMIASTGVDGIYYCFIKGFGDTVFSVNPMRLKGDCVHPVAESLEMLFRLILSCGCESVIEQVNGLSREEFYSYLSEYQPDEEQKAVLCELEEKLNLQPLEKPYEYIKKLQLGFDYSSIEYNSEYYDNLVPDAEECTEHWSQRYISDLSKRIGNCGCDNVAVIGGCDGLTAVYFSTACENKS